MQAGLAEADVQQSAVELSRRFDMDVGADDLEADLAKAGVARVAANELPFFDVMRDEYELNPRRALSSKGGDDPLGFGVGEIGVLVTPIALKVAQQIQQLVIARAITKLRIE
jgi:hypothetical protein